MGQQRRRGKCGYGGPRPLGNSATAVNGKLVNRVESGTHLGGRCECKVSMRLWVRQLFYGNLTSALGIIYIYMLMGWFGGEG